MAEDQEGKPARRKSGKVAVSRSDVLQAAICSRPYTPRTDGKAERFIQTSLREWAYARPYLTSAARNHAVGPWTQAHNLTRPQAGIAGLSPFQRLNNLLGNDS